MAKAARRRHFIARFYLRNFAEPIFSDNLCVYDLREQRWDRRSPHGVGWFPHLFSMTDMDGNRRDDFDQYLKREVEDPAAPALRKMATGGLLDASERSAVALFIALTAARSPESMNSVMEGHLDRLTQADRAELDDLVKQWCLWTGKPYDSTSHNEFLKPSSFGAIWMWSQSLQNRLLQWEWHMVTTTREQPFVTSDRPVLAQWDRDQDVRLVSFPVSSEVALVIIAGGQLNDSRDRSNEVSAMNLQTMDRASEFVVACKETFPGDGSLVRRGQFPRYDEAPPTSLRYDERRNPHRRGGHRPMKLPNLETAVVPAAKITDYLLSQTHPDGRHKARFFRGFGFSLENWQVLEDAVRRHLADHEVPRSSRLALGLVMLSRV